MKIKKEDREKILKEISELHFNIDKLSNIFSGDFDLERIDYLEWQAIKSELEKDLSKIDLNFCRATNFEFVKKI